MPLRVITAPSLAPLRERLFAAIEREPLPLFETEWLVVQSLGMRQWLRYEYARHFDCAGSIESPFPRDLLTFAAKWVHIPTALSARMWTRPTMTWQLNRLLADISPADITCRPLHEYVTHGDDRMRAALAARIADRFDNYALYRPELLTGWEQGALPATRSVHEGWQAHLWRQLVRVWDERPDALFAAAHGNGTDSPIVLRHIGMLAARIMERLSAGNEEFPGIPPRISVFGISSLPPLFVDVLAALGARTEVDIYIVSQRSGTHHPLASMWGAQSAELLQLLREAGAHTEELRVGVHAAGATAAASPAIRKPSLLRQLQQEIADGAWNAELAGGLPAAPLALDRSDRSLQLHAAFGRFRELEVLRDQIYDAFETDPTLQADDVLVLVPDVQAWAPDVLAAFDVQEPGLPKIGVSIADRMSKENPAEQAFLQLLQLEGSRFAFSEVMALLQHPLVRRKAGIESGDIERLANVVHSANVRWGYDDDTLRALEFEPRRDMPTWRRGLDRLLLGQLVGAIDTPINDLLPDAGDTAGDAASIGLLSEWVDRVAETLTRWQTPRTLTEWGAEFGIAIDMLLEGDTLPEKSAVLDLKRRLRKLADQEFAPHATGLPELSIGVMREYLEQELGDDAASSNIMNGRITVAALKPMRSIPFRVIAVAGLNDDAFPRRDRPPAFDLLQLTKKPGDRNLREDDRQLFLDLLLSAQDRLILTWTGRDVRDRAARAPSIVVDELLDYLGGRAGVDAAKALVTLHPLQPFSEHYFSERAQDDAPSGLFTYSTTAAAAAGAALRERSRPPAFAPVPVQVEQPATIPRVLPLRELIKFWEHPAKWFCEQILRVRLPDLQEGRSYDDEWIVLSTMHLGGVRAAVLNEALRGRTDAESVHQHTRRLMASGTLPPGMLGEVTYNVANAAVASVLAKADQHFDGRKPLSVSAFAPLPVQVRVGDWIIRGELDHAAGDHQLMIRGGKFHTGSRIGAWVRHVVACAAREQQESIGSGAPGRAVAMHQPPRQLHVVGLGAKSGRPAAKTFAPVPHAVRVLEQWLRVYEEGRTRPLPLFPQTVLALIEASALATGGTVDESALYSAAEKGFHTPPFNRGGDKDDRDPYIVLSFRGDHDPLAQRYVELRRLTDLFCPRAVSASFPGL